MARDTYATGLRPLSPSQPDDPAFAAPGTLRAGTLIRSVSGPGRDGAILFEASGDGETWSWHRTYAPLRLEGA